MTAAGLFGLIMQIVAQGQKHMKILDVLSVRLFLVRPNSNEQPIIPFDSTATKNSSCVVAFQPTSVELPPSQVVGEGIGLIDLGSWG